MTSIDRRRTPRLEVLDQVYGQIIPLRVPIVVLELGAGGFSTDSFVPFPIGATHLFRFTTTAGIQVTIEATVRHRRPGAKTRASPRSEITGFEFAQDATKHTAMEIGFLLDSVIGTLQIDGAYQLTSAFAD